MENAGLKHLVSEIDVYLKRLFPICRSITGQGNRETLKELQQIVPLSIHEIPSGTKVYDWIVPDEWNIKDAYIADSKGRRIIDFKKNNLHVVNYSTPVEGEFVFSEISSKLHYHPKFPEAIPYRTSYYTRDWGFCVTQSQYKKLQDNNGPLNVVIDSTIVRGSLTYGELLLPGQSKQEILISCYICHPSMANDSLSGVLLTAFLGRYLAGRLNRRWSYRIVFLPETIGAIAYCALNESVMKRIDMGMVITTVGGPGPFGYKQSFNSDHPINRMIEDVFNESNVNYKTYPFDIHGSDERQYSSQGFQINVATISKDRYYEYPYYHTSLDNLDFVSAEQIAETTALYFNLVDKIESRVLYRNCFPNCEVMLSKHDLYPKKGGGFKPGSGNYSETDLILWLLFFSDGKTDLNFISERLGIPIEKLSILAELLVEKGILERA